MLALDISPDDLVDRLLAAEVDGTSILDSCGVGHLNSHLLLAGLTPTRLTIANTAEAALRELNRTFADDRASVFTLSYDLGQIIQGTAGKRDPDEPLVSIATFDEMIVHDYDTGGTIIAGKAGDSASLREMLLGPKPPVPEYIAQVSARTNSTHSDYLRAIESIKEEIRSGNTYQTNLTRRIEVQMPADASAAAIFRRLRTRHPAPFSAYIKRPGSTVISASPERFFKVENGFISASPIKGTRQRGSNAIEDDLLSNELLSSQKDRAENTMIVDLLRNDLGRICEFGTVTVEKLCEIEEHPSLFHLVSTINGKLRKDLEVSEILEALYPCGSITGAPKLSTMKIIDRLELDPRGLSMGAIGYFIPSSFGLGESIDLSVAIRTMVIRNDAAAFNVGGGIVIDSDPEKEWDETVTKSRAILDALGIDAEAVAE